MVANAGIIATKRIFELTVEEWDKVQAVCAASLIAISLTTFQINVRGVFLCYRAAGKPRVPTVKIFWTDNSRGQQMIAQGKGGKIIGACSISGYKPVSQTSDQITVSYS